MRHTLTGLALVVLSALFAAPAIARAASGQFAVEQWVPTTASETPGLQPLVSGRYDAQFHAFDLRAARRSDSPFWVKLEALGSSSTDHAPALLVRKGRHLDVRVYSMSARTSAVDGALVELPRATSLPLPRALHEVAFVVPRIVRGERFYLHVEPNGLAGSEELEFSVAPLEAVLANGESHSRAIALAFGALAAMAVAALLIRFLLPDALFVLYGSLFLLQAIYIAYFSGQGFDWPLLRAAAPLTSHAWNVPAALSGAVACLFAREIADVRRFSPRVHAAFGWLAIAFVVVAGSNFLAPFPFGWVIPVAGNLLFLGSAVFTLVVAFLAWRRGSRPAGWFLLAWVLLECVTIATVLQLLANAGDAADGLLYVSLPMSMVAAAVLIALGVADRVREQRRALSEAERRAQTDPLTGVLNRRSVIERLHAACLRAQARNLPVAVLFIDMDHFKQINDSHGHAAGDACLRAIIGPIQAELRQSDVIGRWGGEEFVVILSSADAAAARPIAQRIVERVATLRVEGFGVPIRLTCSIGVAASDTLGEIGEALISRADAALYSAKNSGRNRVEIAAPLAA